MLDIDKSMPMAVGDIVHVIVSPFPMYNGHCSFHSVYTPSFPFIINRMVFCYPCGNCITDAILQLQKRNPAIVVFDNRKSLFN